MNKIKVANPVVEMDGDEMTKLFGNLSKKNSFPYLDIDIKYFEEPSTRHFGRKISLLPSTLLSISTTYRKNRSILRR